MFFERIESPGLSHISYIVGSGEEAAIIDPKRDVDDYIRILSEENMDLKYVFETHRNEDYVIGSKYLAKSTGAEIFHGEGIDFGYGKTAKNGDGFQVGSLKLDILHTPGHTDESISVVLSYGKVSRETLMVFTGDLMFIGEVGRTDLYGEKRAGEMAGKMYDSIHEKILPLGDHVIINPAHGPGSVCGDDIDDLPASTVGYERRTDPWLKVDRDRFVNEKKRQKLDIPPYFERMEDYNQYGPPDTGRAPWPQPIPVKKLKEHIENGAQVVDVRDPVYFSGGHIPGTLNIWMSGIPSFAGWFLNYDDPILLVGEDDQSMMNTAARYLYRIGYDKIEGYLAGGIFSWMKSGEKIGSIKTAPVDYLKESTGKEDRFILDVRKSEKVDKVGTVDSSHNLFVGYLEKNLSKVPEDREVVVYCDSGYKTGIAGSILKKNDYPDVREIVGGMMAWQNAGYPLK